MSLICHSGPAMEAVRGAIWGALWGAEDTDRVGGGGGVYYYFFTYCAKLLKSPFLLLWNIYEVLLMTLSLSQYVTCILTHH